MTQWLADGERIALPHFGLEFEIHEIPGHTHTAFFGAGTLFCGDTLFAVGCGQLFERSQANRPAIRSACRPRFASETTSRDESVGPMRPT